MSGARGITIVGASAGSGKTYRLTKEVTDAVDPRGVDPVPLEGLFAVTYTKKAHAELAARIRHALVSADAFTEAMRLPLATIGTVHAACLRLLQELALDAGLSPSVDVVAEDQAKLLRQALEDALSDAERAHLDRLATRFRLHWNGQLRRHDWIRPVGEIMDLARGNRVEVGRLAEMGRRSADGLLRLLGEPLADGAGLDLELATELGRALSLLSAIEDETAVTAGAVELLADAEKRLADGELDWGDWAKLAAIKTGKKSAGAVVKVQEIAAKHERHPRLHEELRAFTMALFDAARVGLSAYQAWKKERGVLDYVDMLDGALDLVQHPRVRAELSERLRLVVVDEFQDTSPIQLALFVELHAIAGRSIWVGDRKQCIFEYAGADPLLMDAAAAWVARAGGERDTLSTNYRSRPELVLACSELFARALARHGIPRDEVVVRPSRARLADLDALPPLGLWCLETTKKEHDAEAIAEGVQRILQAPGATPVLDRATGELRDVRPGDVAVLVATNAEAQAIASALHARGVRTAIARAGLLETPEGTLTNAALRWVLDAGDSLASSTLDALTGELGADPDVWLAARIRHDASPVDHAAWRAPLEGMRAQIAMLSPSEAVDAMFAALDLVTLCARWPDPPQRIANLDAIRGAARVYEEGCAQNREAATVAGLLRYFDAMATPSLSRDEGIASDDQHVPSDDGAVILTTYHKAKGLEWPVVVLASLDKGERRDAFAVSPEAHDGAPFDPQRPLEGRWIRYWPWPFGGLRNVPLAARADTSEEGQRVALREDKERARLLYVGFTRARDHLVLAVRLEKSKAKTAWLDVLRLADGAPLLDLCMTAEDGATDAVRIRAAEGEPLSVAARVWRLGPNRVDPASASAEEERRWFARGPRSTTSLSYRIAPSRAHEEWPELAQPTVGEVVTLGGAMPIDGKITAYNVLGDAVHAFLAADLEGLSTAQRLARAERLLRASALCDVVRPDALVGAGDRLRAFVAARWPGARWRREVPIDAIVGSPIGSRRVSGSIDLLLETDDHVIVIDHKTFPGTTEAEWRRKASEFLPQMGAYLEVVGRAVPERRRSCWLHLPVGGGLVELRGPSNERAG